MQAAQLTKYAKDFKLVINDIPVPQPGPTEVLVKVRVAAVNPLEQLIGTGSVKLIQDYAMPVTMGNEIAGVVAAVGASVTDFSLDDAVYARLALPKMGGFAEYVVVDQRDLAPMPTTLDFAHSAAVPLTGLTAYQGLHEELHAHPGQSVLIPGGSGSFGQLAIPLAQTLGLKVFVSGNARSREAVMRLGATQYFDYRQENYWEAMTPVDYVIDTVGPKELAHELEVLKPGGKLLSLKMGPNRQFAKDHDLPWWKTALFSLVGRRLDAQVKQAGGQYRFIFVRSDSQQLRAVTKIVEQEHLVPAIDPTVFKLTDVNAALDLVATGHPQGKVLIRFAD